jgi:uncharacterized protein (TIGR03503 family)
MGLLIRKIAFVALLPLLLPLWVGAAENEIIAADVADVRILIDVSGSMKQNDPRNLRQPALRMLVGLLPGESRAGVWTFGQYVNEEIPLGKVDKGWRKRARLAAEKIHSRGLYTDIEEVLRRSTEDWTKSEGKYSRHLVLLTDGVVDISRNSLANASSRRRIMDDILPRLKKLGVKLHSIALSKTADHHLLKKLSEPTDGWYEQIDEAEQLQRIFLRIFEKVAKPDTVPLKDNKFRIDSSVKEATLLVFSSEGKEPTRVLTPGGISFSSNNPPEGVSWHRDDGYDLLTITKPEVGEWQIQADVDPDNRVIIITDLKMVSNDLPSRVLQGELTKINIQFTDQGKRIVNKEFLDVVAIKSVHIDNNGISEPRPVFDNGKDGDSASGDGVFTLTVGKDIGKGKVELVLTAEGKTFVRERRYVVESIPAVTMDNLEGERGGKAGLMATVMPEPNLVDGQSLQVEAQLIPEQGEPVAVMFLPGPDGMSRESWIDRSELKGSWNLAVNIKAKSVSGSQLEMDLDLVPIQGIEPAVMSEPVQAPQQPTPEVKPEQATEPTPEPDPASEPKVPAPEDADDFGILNIILFALLNLLVFGAGGGAYWYFRKRRGSVYAGLTDEEDDTEAEEGVEEERAEEKEVKEEVEKEEVEKEEVEKKKEANSDNG